MATDDVGLVALEDSGLVLADPDDDLRARSVLDAQGQSVGKVADLVVDEEERRVRFLVVTSGGFLGLGETRRLVPVDAVTDVEDDVHVSTSRETVHGTSEFDPELEPAPDFESVYGQYGYAPFWAPGYVGPMYVRRR